MLWTMYFYTLAFSAGLISGWLVAVTWTDDQLFDSLRRARDDPPWPRHRGPDVTDTRPGESPEDRP